MKYYDACPECARLWQEYSKSTADHVRLQGKLRMAELSHDLNSIVELRQRVQFAYEQREGDRAAIRQHQKWPHAGAAQA
jgi:hypothetical protein